MLKYITFFCSIIGVANTQQFQQGPDNVGTEFYISFLEMESGTETNPVEIYITSGTHYPARYNISSPLMPGLIQESGVLQPGVVEMYQGDVDLRQDGSRVQDRSVYITSDTPIAVYGANKETFTMDAFTAFPSDVLSTYYMVTTYTTKSTFSVIATEPDTTVTVTLKTQGCIGSTISGGTVEFEHQNGQTETYSHDDVFSETIHRFQTLTVSATMNTEVDFTGTIITSDKPIAVYGGSVRSHVALSSSSDHLVEMYLPVNTWGKFFALTPTPSRFIGDIFRILSGIDNNQINIGGTFVQELQEGECLELDRDSDSYDLMETSGAVQVMIFSKTHGRASGGDNPDGGDPFMSTVMAFPQFAASYIIATINPPTGYEFEDTIAMVIRDQGDKDDLMLDGTRVGDLVPPAQWMSVGTSFQGWEFYYMSYEVADGQHEIYHPNPLRNFLVLETGLTEYTSYGIIAGARAASINTNCTVSVPVPGDIVDNDCDQLVDEEAANGEDDDGDGRIDEDLAFPERINGAWSPWGDYTECSQDLTFPCDDTRSRTRLCDNPEPQYGGYPCSGPGITSIACAQCALVQLRAGNSDNEGRVYLYDEASDTWGTICAQDYSEDNWPLVVCYELGYIGVTSVDLASNTYVGVGSSDEQVIFHHPNCTPVDVTYTYQCANSTDQYGMCTHQQDIYIKCLEHLGYVTTTALPGSGDDDDCIPCIILGVLGGLLLLLLILCCVLCYFCCGGRRRNNNNAVEDEPRPHSASPPPPATEADAEAAADTAPPTTDPPASVDAAANGGPPTDAANGTAPSDGGPATDTTSAAQL